MAADRQSFPRAAAAAPRGALAGRPAGPGRDRARAQPRLQAQAVRAAGHGRPASRSGTRRGWPGTASTPPASARCGPGSRPNGPGAGRPGLPRPVAAGARPAGQEADLDPARHAPGPVARAVRRRGRAGLGRGRGSCRSASRRRSSRRSRPATGRPRSRRCSTTSGPTAAACSTAGWRPGRSPRSAGGTSRYLMGYDLLNEPWMGIEWPTCLTSGCPASYPTELQPAMEAGLRAVRAIDPRQHRLVGAAAVRRRPAGRHLLHRARGGAAARPLLAQLLPGGLPGEPGRPGHRRESCRAYSDGREQHALEQSERMHAVPMMSEWGATDNLTRDQDRRRRRRTGT